MSPVKPVPIIQPKLFASFPMNVLLVTKSTLPDWMWTILPKLDTELSVKLQQDTKPVELAASMTDAKEEDIKLPVKLDLVITTCRHF